MVMIHGFLLHDCTFITFNLSILVTRYRMGTPIYFIFTETLDTEKGVKMLLFGAVQGTKHLTDT